MSTIIIRKGTMTKKVTRYAWDLMGKNKQGWEEVETNDQIAVNEVSPARVQPSVVDAGPVVNEATTVEEPTAVNEITETSKTSETGSSFVEQAKELNLKTGVLKDFCDINSISYKPKDKPETLLEKIGEFLGNDIEKFKKEFGA